MIHYVLMATSCFLGRSNSDLLCMKYKNNSINLIFSFFLRILLKLSNGQSNHKVNRPIPQEDWNQKAGVHNRPRILPQEPRVETSLANNSEHETVFRTVHLELREGEEQCTWKTDFSSYKMCHLGRYLARRRKSHSPKRSVQRVCSVNDVLHSSSDQNTLHFPRLQKNFTAQLWLGQIITDKFTARKSLPCCSTRKNFL